MHFGKILRRTIYLTEKNDFSKAKLIFFSFLFYISSFSICSIQAANPKEFEDQSTINQVDPKVEASSFLKMISEMVDQLVEMIKKTSNAIRTFSNDQQILLKLELTKEELDLKKENLGATINGAIETIKRASDRILHSKVAIIRILSTRLDGDIFLEIESKSCQTVLFIQKIVINCGFAILEDLKEYETVSLERKETLFAKIRSNNCLAIILVMEELINRQNMLSFISEKIFEIKKSQSNYENSGLNIEKIEELFKILKNQKASYEKIIEEAQISDEEFEAFAMKFYDQLNQKIKSPLFTNTYKISMFKEAIRIYFLAYYEILANNYSFLEEHQANNKIIITNKTKEFEDLFYEKFKELEYDPEDCKKYFAELIDKFKTSLFLQTRLNSFVQFTYQLFDFLKMFPKNSMENMVFCQFFEPLFERLEKVQLLELLEYLKNTEDSNLEISSEKLDAIANDLSRINNELAVSLQITNNLFNAERIEATNEAVNGIKENKKEKEEQTPLNHPKKMDRPGSTKNNVAMFKNKVKKTLFDRRIQGNNSCCII